MDNSGWWWERGEEDENFPRLHGPRQGDRQATASEC